MGVSLPKYIAFNESKVENYQVVWLVKSKQIKIENDVNFLKWTKENDDLPCLTGRTYENQIEETYFKNPLF